jgi:hypothetical protein
MRAAQACYDIADETSSPGRTSPRVRTTVGRDLHVGVSRCPRGGCLARRRVRLPTRRLNPWEAPLGEPGRHSQHPLARETSVWRQGDPRLIGFVSREKPREVLASEEHDELRAQQPWKVDGGESHQDLGIPHFFNAVMPPSASDRTYCLVREGTARSSAELHAHSRCWALRLALTIQLTVRRSYARSLITTAVWGDGAQTSIQNVRPRGTA